MQERSGEEGATQGKPYQHPHAVSLRPLTKRINEGLLNKSRVPTALQGTRQRRGAEKRKGPPHTQPSCIRALNGSASLRRQFSTDLLQTRHSSNRNPSTLCFSPAEIEWYTKNISKRISISKISAPVSCFHSLVLMTFPRWLRTDTQIQMYIAISPLFTQQITYYTLFCTSRFSS